MMMIFLMDESGPSISIWSAVHSWITAPTVLFVLLNLMIGTIAVTSGHLRPTTNTKKDSSDDPQNPNPNPLVRSPSLLHRLRSFNLNLHRQSSTADPLHLFQETPIPPPSTSPPAAEPIRSETKTEKTERKVKKGSAARKMRKSASVKAEKGKIEVEVEVERRAETVRVGRRREVEGGGGDEEVDSKADDFINRFRQQLKLQRLDSVNRYQEILNRAK
ncbi:hypothetical protein QJS10_CPB22g00745 [Acorus calamus]|uniref:DUF4408 domain-containing protein n=1 Tax=Acorus calamus TaxID=4465 RepID=A0AAV9C081_ACOCL|nr:hypothetical protein QJS10_CPB22g00745 [Acorus calamus]